MLQGHKDGVYSIDLSPTGGLLATGSRGHAMICTKLRFLFRREHCTLKMCNAQVVIGRGCMLHVSPLILSCIMYRIFLSTRVFERESDY